MSLSSCSRMWQCHMYLRMRSVGKPSKRMMIRVTWFGFARTVSFQPISLASGGMGSPIRLSCFPPEETYVFTSKNCRSSTWYCTRCTCIGCVESVRLIKFQISVEWFRGSSVTGSVKNSPPGVGICMPFPSRRRNGCIGLMSTWLRVRLRTLVAELGLSRWNPGNFFGSELVSRPESGRVTRNCMTCKADDHIGALPWRDQQLVERHRFGQQPALAADLGEGLV